MNEIYLGDGAYASFDGFAITLRAPREHGDDIVVLERDMLDTLNEFAAKCWPARSRSQS